MPVGAAPRAGGGHQGGDDSGRLAVLWAAETPAELEQDNMPDQGATGETCPHCQTPTVWHSARTAVYCPGCGVAGNSAGLLERAAAHQAATTRQQRTGGAELADPRAEAEARAERLQVHQQREALERLTRQAIDWCDLELYDRVQYQRTAFTVGSRLRAYLPEIASAKTTATLLELLHEIKAIQASDDYRGLITEATETDQRRRQAERAAEAAELEAAEAERAAERHALEQAAARRAELEQPQRTAIAAAPAPPGSAVTVLASAYQLGEFLRDTRAARKQAIVDHGACAWCRKPAPATRVYGVGLHDTWQNTITLSADHASRRACDKHHGAANIWLQQTHGASGYYWELTS